MRKSKNSLQEANQNVQETMSPESNQEITQKTLPQNDNPPQTPPESEFAQNERLREEQRESLFASFGFKCVIVLAMVLIFQIPMLFIRNLIRDRKDYHRDAEKSILEPKGGQPELQGVLIAIPYDESVFIVDEKGGRTRSSDVRRYLFATPEKFFANASVKPEMLKRGIFEVPVFNCDINISGGFDEIETDSIAPLIENFTPENDKIRWSESLLLVGISNKKILTALPQIKIAGEVLHQSLYEPRIGSPFSNTVYYDLGEKAKDGFDFEMLVKLQGGKAIAVMPLATENKFNIESNWKTPGFGGGWLPTEREIGESGFKAEWNIPGLSTNFPRRWTSASEKILVSKATKNNEFEYDDYRVPKTASTDKIAAESVAVNFYQPVDNYQKATRSAKYSILFLLVPFIALLVFEVFSKVKIHPIQYGLIGLANVVFYLLLLSISEHIPFNLTYWISSAAVSALMLFYGASIFNKFSYGLFFAAVNLVSYIFLFGTLQAEDYALLIGSLGIFAVVAVLMILTRKIDWYKLRDFYKESENYIED